MGCTVSELQDRIEYSEFVEWIAFYEAEPFGESRTEIQTAMLAAVISNVNRSKKSKKVKPSDFLIDWWKDSSKPQALMAKFRAMEQQMSATDQRAKVAKPKNNGTRPRNISRRSGS